MSKRNRNASSTSSTSSKGKGKGKDVPPVVTQGNIPLTQRLSPKELESSVNSLLEQLRNADTRQEKKRLRRMLRTRNHFGGLGIVAQRNAQRSA